MKLVPTPENPAPDNPEVMEVKTSDGLFLRAARWLPEHPVKGTVCVFQGRAEFIEKYFETIQELLQRGFAVAAFDWRGQGLSSRQVKNPYKGYVASFESYRKDLDAIVAQVLPALPQPHYGLAHSMGGAIALNASARSQCAFKRLVITAPLIRLGMVRNSEAVSVLTTVLYRLGFGKSFIPGGTNVSISEKPFADNPLTGDPKRYARNAAVATALAEGAIGDPTIAWLYGAFRQMAAFRDPGFAGKIKIPTLILAAGADEICSTPATERFAVRLKTGRAIVLPGSRHEILMERDEIREQFWAAFDAFIPGTSVSTPVEQF